MTLPDKDRANLLKMLWLDRDRLPMFVVYDHPTDWPDFYAARLWLSLPQPQALDTVLLERDLDALRRVLSGLGLVCLMSDQKDEPHIVETWI